MNEILLYGTVGSSFWDEEYFTAKTVREQLAGLSGPLTVRINSGGGFATEGQAIYSALKSYPGEVNVVIDGIAASAASLIAMAGDTITMPLGSLMMIHDPADWLYSGRGTEDDYLKLASSLRVLANAYAGIYAKTAGITADAAREIMKAETYYDGPAALAAGFATATDDEHDALAPAAFDYSIYGHAPETLRAAAGPVPRRRAAASVMAMMAGSIPHRTKETPMRKPKMTAATAAENEDGVTEDDEDAAAETEEEGEDAAAEDDAETEGEGDGEDDAEAESEEEDEEIDGAEALAITRMCARRNLGADRAADFISRGLTCKQAVAEINTKGKPVSKVSRAPNARILRDERETRRAGMSEAIAAQIGRKREVKAQARPYMGMSLVEMAAASIDHRGPIRNAGQKIEVMMAASHSTSDFPAIFQNALNKQLLERYTLAEPTYRMIARQKNFRDFRPMPLVRAGDFPMLKPIGEGGEIKWGTFGESGETAVIGSYGVGLTISRQMIINDDLSAIDEMLSSYGNTVAMFEERTFYAFALTAAMADGTAIFHADHGNLAGAAAAITTAAVSLGRAAMRKQKSLDGNNLNISPSVLLVGPDKETEAEMFLAAITPTESSNVNPFSGKMKPVVTAEIAGNAWYLLSEMNPCWVYGFLEGAEAPRLRTEEPFGTQGFSMTLEHDFGFGAVDHRGGYKNAGA